MVMKVEVYRSPVQILFGARNSDRTGARPANLVEYAGTFLGLIRGWADRARQRRALADLDDRLLKDVGISREQAESEVQKPFWI